MRKKKPSELKPQCLRRWQGGAGCHIPSFIWEKGWHSHHPYKEMTTSMLPLCSWREELPIASTRASACFLKQMILFHSRMSLCKIRFSPFHQGYPWTSGDSTPFQKSGFIGVYSKFRGGRAMLDSLCLLPHLLMCHDIQSVALQQAQELDSCPCLGFGASLCI